MGELAVSQGRTIEGQLLLDKVVDLEPKLGKNEYRRNNIRARVRSSLALLKERKGDWQGASELLKTVLAEDPSNPTLVARMARCLFKAEKIEEAETVLRNAWESDKEKFRQPEFPNQASAQRYELIL